MEGCVDSTFNFHSKYDENFWQSINILITKPHVINKRLWGATIVNNCYIDTKAENWDENHESYELNFFVNMQEFLNAFSQANRFQITDRPNDNKLVIVELLPKLYNDSHAFQMICINKRKKKVTFYDITPHQFGQKLCPLFPYSFLLKDNKIILNCKDTSSKSYLWLKNDVLPQLIKWSEEFCENQAKICSDSLALVGNDRYYSKYNHLKKKYGKKIIDIWPESTDPLKFVYEDIAIATYLLLLWEKYGCPQSFADVGCGNGLLVYLLTMEGHNGFGIDVRKRKIWNLYPENIVLKEYTVTPYNINIFLNIDWIIGNHSDELTPWIPVIALKSSYKSKLFLLPCCAYNLDGTKYRRRDSSKSQYTEYLKYIKKLCEDCGFNVELDRLKIPSTKRICFVAESRKYEESEYLNYITRIQNLIRESVQHDASGESSFKAREAVEKVRNCTQVDKTITELIVKEITDYLLQNCDSEENWSRGRKAEIYELAQLISPDKLQALKSECGGLQTLLKNNHSIFEVQNGTVQIRYPRRMDEMFSSKKKKTGKELKLKNKQCWFYKNHPQGCPLEDSVCSFIHEK